jgi:hypothetical protein
MESIINYIKNYSLLKYFIIVNTFLLFFKYTGIDIEFKIKENSFLKEQFASTYTGNELRIVEVKKTYYFDLINSKSEKYGSSDMEEDAEKLWPFVPFFIDNTQYFDSRSQPTYYNNFTQYESEYFCPFNNYDFTEFILFFLIFIIFKRLLLSNENKDKKSELIKEETKEISEVKNEKVQTESSIPDTKNIKTYKIKSDDFDFKDNTRKDLGLISQKYKTGKSTLKYTLVVFVIMFILMLFININLHNNVEELKSLINSKNNEISVLKITNEQLKSGNLDLNEKIKICESQKNLLLLNNSSFQNHSNNLEVAVSE